jgi:tRNA-splicing ligase RtcB
MISKKDFKKISNWLWEIPKSFRNDMRVPVRVYVSEKMLEHIFRDRSLNQVINVASLPGIVNYSLAMPDMHEGYGFPIGGVAAVDMTSGVISPGGVGYDINCGMRVLKSDLNEKEIKPYIDKLATEIQRQVPSGLGRGRKVKLDIDSINKILEKGAKALIDKGYGDKEDLENCEANGNLKSADPSFVSDRAKNRGRNQVGTLGSGNHFIEVQRVDAIFDEDIARVFGLFKDQVVIMIHTGSRGLGHQIASDYIKVMMSAMPKYNINLPDRELAACPINSDEGKRYLSAMACGANYAWANRQMIAYSVREAWKSVLSNKATSLRLLYDVAHNIAKIEEHEINGRKTELCVHRKGATRAFPPNHPEIPEKYKDVGQPVLIPGSMGTASYILAGRKEGEQSFYSTCHGAGRRMSRKQAIRTISGQNVVKELKEKGIIVKCFSSRGVAEEAPQAYKDIDSVVDVVHNAKLSKKVAKLAPLAVIKGE